jgi:hypothetical protein
LAPYITESQTQNSNPGGTNTRNPINTIIQI